MRTRSTLVRLLAATCLLGALAVPITRASAASAAPVNSSGGHNDAFAQPNSALGANWHSSPDEVVSGTGDSDGYHVMVAKADDAYAWTNLVTLNVPSGDVGPWTGEICQTGDGKYALYKKSNAPGIYRRSLLGDLARNPEELLIPDFLPNGQIGGYAPVATGIYYVSGDEQGRARPFRFFDYASRKSIDVAPAAPGLERGFTISPDRRRILFPASADVGGDLLSLELK